MNGPRTNQFVAPTSFITSISRRREKIDSRIVFAISSVDAASRTTTAIRKTDSMIVRDAAGSAFAVFLPYFDLLDAGRRRRSGPASRSARRPRPRFGIDLERGRAAGCPACFVELGVRFRICFERLVLRDEPDRLHARHPRELMRDSSPPASPSRLAARALGAEVDLARAARRFSWSDHDSAHVPSPIEEPEEEHADQHGQRRRERRRRVRGSERHASAKTARNLIRIRSPRGARRG